MKETTMNTKLLLAGTIAAAAAAAAPSSLACGEGQFNMGQGLRYQGYLATRAANVLIYAEVASADLADRQATYHGLEHAGHHVTVVSDPEHLAQALAANRYDVVIASADEMDAGKASDANATPQPRLLPVGGPASAKQRE